MKLKDFSTFKTEVQDHWYSEIEDGGYSNEEELKTTLDDYLNDLQTEYDNYINGQEKGTTEQILLSLYSYVSYRYNINSDDDCPSTEEIIEDDDLRNLYLYWTYDLPSDYDSLFEITEDSETGEDILNTQDAYDNLKQNMEDALDSDSDELSNFPENAAKAIRSKTIYITYKKTPITINDIDVRCFVLNDMHFQEVIDTFDLTFNGINENVDPC